MVDSIIWWALESDDSSWAIDGGGDELRADVARWVEDDRFDFISEMAGVAPKDRGRVLTLLPMRGEILLTVEEFRADEGVPTSVSIQVYLDLVGRQIAAAAGRPLVTLVSIDSADPEVT